MDHLDTSRIDHLINGGRAAGVRVVTVGLGSGGWPVVQYLAMGGVRRWTLFDPDVLEPVNLVKHPARRADLGRPKAELMRDWLLDRNPEVQVECHVSDVRDGDEFERAIGGADLVILAVDNLATREYVNDLCVIHGVPFVSGSVFRTGFAGEVYAWRPGSFGCLRCQDEFCRARNLSFDERVGLTQEEEHRIYGLDDRSFALSGLAVDIGAIAAAHAHLAVSLLFGQTAGSIPPLTANWIVLANRPFPGAFDFAPQVRRLVLRPQNGCLAGCGGRERDAASHPPSASDTDLGEEGA